VNAPSPDTFVRDDNETAALRELRNGPALAASVDPVRTYLTQIGKFTLLSAAGEVELAKRIEAGLYAAEQLSASRADNET
jgi:RNA polymerase primary sigma factor